MLLRDVRYWYSVCCAMFLRACHAMSGTEIAYGATRAAVCRLYAATPGLERDPDYPWHAHVAGHAPYLPTRWPIISAGPAGGEGVRGILLRLCYALSGTDKAYGAILLRLCYALSGTDIAYGVPDIAYGTSCCAISGTDIAYPAIVLCNARY
eukprot:242128-Rhodomonas_salina.5